EIVADSFVTVGVLQYLIDPLVTGSGQRSVLTADDVQIIARENSENGRESPAGRDRAQIPIGKLRSVCHGGQIEHVPSIRPGYRAIAAIKSPVIRIGISFSPACR